MLGTQTQPGREVLHRREPREVRANLAQKHQRRRLIDPLNGRQIDPAGAMHQTPCIVRRLVRLELANLGTTRQGLASAPIGKGRQVALDLMIAFANQILIRFPETNGLLEREQVLLAPVAQQGLGESGLADLAVLVAELGELKRVAFALEDGVEDVHAGLAGDVADDLGEFEVHLFECFLDVLNMLRGITDEHLSLSEISTQDDQFIRGPE